MWLQLYKLYLNTILVLWNMNLLSIFASHGYLSQNYISEIQQSENKISLLIPCDLYFIQDLCTEATQPYSYFHVWLLHSLKPIQLSVNDLTAMLKSNSAWGRFHFFSTPRYHIFFSTYTFLIYPIYNSYSYYTSYFIALCSGNSS